MTIWHAPEPGPGYWDYRCLRCSEPVSKHASWWRRLFHRDLNAGVKPPTVGPKGGAGNSGAHTDGSGA